MKHILPALIALAATVLPLAAEPITVLTSGNRLLTVDTATPATLTQSAVTITGLEVGDNLVGIDYRPAAGVLFGLGSASNVYTIDVNTGVATVVGPPVQFVLNGTRFGFDFNPVPDRIRVTSDADQNLRLNPNNGALAGTDTVLAYAAGDPNAGQNPNIVGSAYINSFPGAAVTTLYDIDSNLDILTIQDPPNNGALNTVGALGVDTTDSVGFDISPTSGVAYASLTVAAANGLYTINLRTGAATLVGLVAPVDLGAETVVDIAAVADAGARLRNISTRGRVGMGDDVLIAGFITRGRGVGASGTCIVRALGPSLAGLGVGSPLADPVLTLFDQSGMMIATNDDFSASTDAAAITAAGLAPTNGIESAILATGLAPGAYTAIVTQKGTDTGIALVEVYELP